MEIKDSGIRREFETGAVRDIQDGKGRCDLLPLGTISSLLRDEILLCIGLLRETRSHGARNDAVKTAIREFCRDRGWNEYEAILEVAKQYEQGALKYGERNWEKGIPAHSYIDSAVRHYLKYKSGMVDEPHDRAFMFNLLGYLWTVTNKPELDDYYCVEEPGSGGEECLTIYYDGGSSTSSETTKKNE